MPKLSIIVPTYNCCDYLKDCLNDLTKLPFPAVEVIIVNDGSKDETAEFLNSIEGKYPGFKIINQSNGGVSKARNTGLEIAQGEYIYFCDSDDEILLDPFLKALEFISNNDSDVFVYNFLNQNRDLVSTRNYYPRSRTGLMTGPEFLIHSIETKEFGGEPYQFFFKREKFSNYRFIEKIIHEDEQFFACLIFDAKSVFITNEAIYQRKYRLDSLSRDVDEKPRNSPENLLMVMDSYLKKMNEVQSSEARRIFKTLIIRAWMIIFNFYNKVPEKKDVQILTKKPSIWEIVKDKDISFRYRLRYLSRVLKLK